MASKPGWGGKRAGAGRKKAQTVEIPPGVAKVVDGEPLDPRPTLELIALGRMEVSAQQYKALVALLPFVHPKKGTAAAKPEKPAKPAESKYGVRQGPRLAAAGGKRF